MIHHPCRDLTAPTAVSFLLSVGPDLKLRTVTLSNRCVGRIAHRRGGTTHVEFELIQVIDRSRFQRETHAQLKMRLPRFRHAASERLRHLESFGVHEH